MLKRSPMPSDKDGFDSSLEGESSNTDENNWYYVKVFNNEYNTFEEVIYISFRCPLSMNCGKFFF